MGSTPVETERQALGSIRQLSINWVDPVRDIIEFTRHGVFFWSFNWGSNQQNWDLTNRWNPQNWGFHWFNQQNSESGHHLYTVHADFGSHTHTQSRSEKRIVYAGSGIRGMAFICSARVARVAVRPLSWEKLRPEPRKAEKSWEMGRDEKNWEVRYPLHPNLGCVHPLFASASES